MYISELRDALLVMRDIDVSERTIAQTLNSNGYTRKMARPFVCSY